MFLILERADHSETMDADEPVSTNSKYSFEGILYPALLALSIKVEYDQTVLYV